MTMTEPPAHCAPCPTTLVSVCACVREQPGAAGHALVLHLCNLLFLRYSLTDIVAMPNNISVT